MSSHFEGTDRPGDRSRRQLVTQHLQSGSRERWVLVPSWLPPFCSAPDSSPWDGAALSEGGFSHLVPHRHAQRLVS